MVGSLTWRQFEVLLFIRDFIDEHGYAPTVRQTCKKFGFNYSRAWQHIIALKKKGFLVACNTKKGTARNIKLTDKLAWIPNLRRKLVEYYEKVEL
jgi:SOS-response transcriptional repressor LexA